MNEKARLFEKFLIDEDYIIKHSKNIENFSLMNN